MFKGEEEWGGGEQRAGSEAPPLIGDPNRAGSPARGAPAGPRPSIEAEEAGKIEPERRIQEKDTARKSLGARAAE